MVPQECGAPTHVNYQVDKGSEDEEATTNSLSDTVVPEKNWTPTYVNNRDGKDKEDEKAATRSPSVPLVPQKSPHSCGQPGLPPVKEG